MSRRIWIVAGIAAAAALVVGIVLVVMGAIDSGNRWFVYAPLSGTVFVPGDRMVVSILGVWGAVVCGVGLAALTFLAGIAIGRRRRREDRRPEAL